MHHPQVVSVIPGGANAKEVALNAKTLEREAAESAVEGSQGRRPAAQRRAGAAVKTAILGSGLIGRSWAMVFARGGHEVLLWDQDEAQVGKALTHIAAHAADDGRDGADRGCRSRSRAYQGAR